MFGVYRRYPFHVPMRVRFFNVFRSFFRLGLPERFLVSKITGSPYRYWQRMVPPIYFYPTGSFRVVNREGITFRLDLSKQLDHSIYFSLLNDPAWRNLLQIVRPNFRVIDIGANIGYLTLQFASRCPEGFVHAFEPDSETFLKLNQNVVLNPYNNIKLFQCALGAITGKANLYKLYESNPGANRILPGAPDKQVPSETVDVTTLDILAEQVGKVDLIKVDVEGFELFVLHGAQRVIHRHRPILFVELADINLAQQGCNGEQVIEWLTRSEYLILDARTMKPLVRSDKYYTDILCFPTSAAAYA